MSIRKIDDNTFHVRVTKVILGKRYERKSTLVNASQGMARKNEKELIESLSKFAAEMKSRGSVDIWGRAVEDFFEQPVRSYKESTLYNMRMVTVRHTKSFYNLRLSQLNLEFLKDFFTKVSISEMHKKELRKYMYQILEQQLLKGNIQINPLKYLKLESNKNFRSKASHLSAMTKDELSKFLALVKDTDIELYKIFVVTYHLGLRSSEAVALEYSDIDWDRNHVRITKVVVNSKKVLCRLKMVRVESFH